MATIYEDGDGNRFVWDGKQMVPAEQPAAPSEPYVSASQELIDSVGPVRAALIAAGREFHKMGRGVQGWFADDEEKARLDAVNRQEDELYEPLSDARPYSTAVGSTLPYLAPIPGSMAVKGAQAGAKAVAPVGRMARNIHRAKQVATAPVSKAVAGGTAVGAAHQDMTAAEGAALAGAGYGAGKLLAAPLSRVKNDLGSVQKEVVNWAKKKGFNLPPGMKTGNIGLQEVDQALGTRVGTSNIMENYNRTNQKLANQIAAEKLGVKGVEEFTPTNLAMARNKITGEMRDLAKNTDGIMTLDDQVDIYNNIWRLGKNKFKKGDAELLKEQVDDVFRKGVEDVPGLSGAKRFNGRDYQEINRILRDIKDDAFRNGNSQLGHAVGKIQGKFDDAVERGMKMTQSKTGAASRWRDVRAKYRFLNDVENSMSSSSSGNLDLQALNRNYLSRDRTRMLEGKMFDKDMEMLAKLGDLQSNQRGASLGASQMLGNILKGHNSATIMDLLSRKNMNIPLVDDIAVRLYRSGWPSTTGWLGLPAGAPVAAGKVGAASALGIGSDYMREK